MPPPPAAARPSRLFLPPNQRRRRRASTSTARCFRPRCCRTFPHESQETNSPSILTRRRPPQWPHAMRAPVAATYRPDIVISATYGGARVGGAAGRGVDRPGSSAHPCARLLGCRFVDCGSVYVRRGPELSRMETRRALVVQVSWQPSSFFS
uniref:Uncharacterized protein n=1 Tax=Triticum urartu TaxID=4572 RepID=A0A8R7K1U7_TRIUA